MVDWVSAPIPSIDRGLTPLFLFSIFSYLGEGSYGVVIATEDTTDKDNKVR